MRLGILGGTFDPIHLGHLLLAEEVGEELELENVYLIPAALPPHKEPKAVTKFHHRLEMTRLATDDSTLLKTLDLEGRRQGFSFSIETLEEFHGLFRPDPELFFIIGIDAFLQIDTWKDYQRLFDYTNFVVIKRPGFRTSKFEPYIMSMDIEFRRDKGEDDLFRSPSGHLIFLKEARLIDISSTMIRERIVGGKSVRFMVPERVRDYIIEKELYKGNGDS